MPQIITNRGLKRNLGNKIGVRGNNAGFDKVSWFDSDPNGSLRVGIKGTLIYDDKTERYAVSYSDRKYFLKNKDEIVLRPRHPTCLTRTYTFFVGEQNY